MDATQLLEGENDLVEKKAGKDQEPSHVCVGKRAATPFATPDRPQPPTHDRTRTDTGTQPQSRKSQ